MDIGGANMYAIIATGGKQYKVAEGDVIRVEKLGVEAGSTYTFDQVLAVSNDGLKECYWRNQFDPPSQP